VLSRVLLITSEKEIKETVENTRGVELVLYYDKAQGAIAKLKDLDYSIMIMDLNTIKGIKQLEDLCTDAEFRGIRVILLTDTMQGKEVKNQVEMAVEKGVYSVILKSEFSSKKLMSQAMNYPTGFNLNELNVAKTESGRSKKIEDNDFDDSREGQTSFTVPKGYRKCVGFLGYPGSGVTTILCSVAYNLAKNGLNCCIIDLNKNRDMDEIFISDDKKGAVSSLEDLLRLNMDPFRVSKKISVFKAPFNSSVDMGNITKAIDTVLYDYDVVLIDLDYEISVKASDKISDIYLVQTLDPTSTKIDAKFLNTFKDKHSIKKIKLIVNKVIACANKPGEIVDYLRGQLAELGINSGGAVDWDPQYFTIPFSIELMKNSLNGNFTNNNLDKITAEKIQVIANDIYPVKVKKGWFK